MEFGQKEVQDEFVDLENKLEEVFPNEAGFQNMGNYLRGLLGNVERKNGWQMSEYVGETTPYALQ